MNINNGELLSLLFDEPKLAAALNQAIPYISVFRNRTTLNLRCAGIATFFTLLQYRQEILRRINSLLGYEICLECEEKGDDFMVAAAELERTTETRNATDRFLSLETLSRATAKSPQEVKKLLGRAREVIHLMEDGSEMITETAFDNVVLDWAKSYKGDSDGSQSAATTASLSKQSTTSLSKQSTRKPSARILVSKLTIEDIIRVKSGKSANSPNMTEKGVQQTLDNFFSKVKMDDTSKIDAISAFIEGTSEFGLSLRKELISAYQKFTKDPNLQEVQDKLIDGAKAYLEKSSDPEAAEIQG